jgi:hypothetical protein
MIESVSLNKLVFSSPSGIFPSNDYALSEDPLIVNGCDLSHTFIEIPQAFCEAYSPITGKVDGETTTQE